MHALILFDDFEYHGFSADIMYTWLFFALMYSDKNAFKYLKYAALINGGYNLKINEKWSSELLNSFHPMAFVKNDGVIINTRVFLKYMDKYKFDIHQNIDLTRRKDYKFGFYLGIDFLHNKEEEDK